jgi:hypothetical protein
MKLSPDHDGKKQPPKKVQNPTDNDSFNLKQINPNAAGIDLGSGEHWVCVPPERAQVNVRRFGCFTPDLMVMANWLTECGVTSVAGGGNRSLLDTSISNLGSFWI